MNMNGMTIDEAVPQTNRARAARLRMNALRDIPVRSLAFGLIVTLSLSLAPLLAADAADGQPTESAISGHAKAFGAAVKRDTKAVGATIKEGARRVAVAAKAVGHEIATAAKRGATETRAAFRGDKSGAEST
jgi:hypothetical protein